MPCLIRCGRRWSHFFHVRRNGQVTVVVCTACNTDQQWPSACPVVVYGPARLVASCWIYLSFNHFAMHYVLLPWWSDVTSVTLFAFIVIVLSTTRITSSLAPRIRTPLYKLTLAGHSIHRAPPSSALTHSARMKHRFVADLYRPTPCYKSADKSARIIVRVRLVASWTGKSPDTPRRSQRGCPCQCRCRSNGI